MNNRTIVIAGIGGFIGRHLAAVLRAAYPQAIIVGLGRGECADADEMRTADLLDADQVQDVFDRVEPHFVFHVAGNLYSTHWQELYDANVRTTINLLDAARRMKTPPRIVIPGSAAEYGAVDKCDLPLLEAHALSPVSPYGVAKTWQTTMARYYASGGLDVIIGRLFNVIGPGIRETLSIGAFASQLRKIRGGEMPARLHVGNLAPKRDFIDVRDVSHALVLLAQHGASGEVYNICSGASVSMRDILDEMIRCSGLDVEVSQDPARMKSVDVEDIYGSNARLRAVGWNRSISLGDSILSLVGCKT